jgi:hypothetical protein
MNQERTESRERRRAARERLASLRAELREARARRRDTLVDAKERCRAERLANRERHRALRIRAAQELRDRVRDERASARAACAERRANARRIANDVGRTRAELAAERALQADLRRVEKSEQSERKACACSANETDEQVQRSLPSDLVPLFERVKGSLKARRGGPLKLDAFLVLFPRRLCGVAIARMQ